MRYFLRLAYDGTDFHGWQIQPNAISVQEKITNALSTILQENVKLTGAGRTDTGVHALEMFAHFDAPEIKDKEKFIRSLNLMVGKAISVYEIIKVRQEAHARFDALKRTYNYVISLKENPFLVKYSFQTHRKPDVELMNEAALKLLDVKDFTSFSKLHTDTKTNICEVYEAEWKFQDDPSILVFTITADRFLRNMVRAIVGTLLDVGYSKISLLQFENIIKKKDRCAAGTSMPAAGLFLANIEYPKGLFLS